jgi:AmiR/NasT family two-component response regulator
MSIQPPPEAGEADFEREELQVALRRLLRVTEASLEQRRHLERALAGRIEIEQAKGVLAERLRIGLDAAFELLRQTARAERRTVRDLARTVLASRETPTGILLRLHGLLRDEGIKDRANR